MKFHITGMSCAACSARIEKTVKALQGVDYCSVNLLTKTMDVRGSFEPDSIISAINKIGYGASLSDKEKSVSGDNMVNLKFRIILSVICVVVLMYFSMGHMINMPLPPYFLDNSMGIAILELLLSAFVLVLNQNFFINGFKGILRGVSNMDTLVSLGAGASFIYSVILVFRMCCGDDHVHGLYFESAAMIVTLISVGKLLEEYSKGKTTSAIKSLVSMKPKSATVIKNNIETVVDIDDVLKGDIFIVKPGDSIPVDGKILDGCSSVDESVLTGESIPVDKNIGDNVSAATINKSGYLKCIATNVGEETALAQIIKIVSDSTAGKAPIAKIADKISGVFVPTVISISAVTFIIWFLINKDFTFAFERAISVLVISCPCSLGLATPVAIMVGSGVAAKNGILFKNASALEEAGRIKTVVFDKTGTVTKGKPEVTDIFSDNEELLLRIAASMELKSEHPLGCAIVEEAKKRNIEFFDTFDFNAFHGKGISCTINDKRVYGGNLSFMPVKVEEKFIIKADEYSKVGKTPLFFSSDDDFLGLIALSDTLKDDSVETVTMFKQAGIRVHMLTGDNEKTAKYIAEKICVDDYKAEILPETKASCIKELKKIGKVAMVGDGINDAPALTVADVGIAIGAGTDIAIDSASIVLMNDNLIDVYNSIKIGKAVLKNIKENLFWAFFYNCIGIPLAAGVFIAIFSWEMNPMFGAAAMSLSSFCVVSNALRLNLIKINKKEKKMKKVLKIGGMMCGHCEARVKKLLENLPQVDDAVVSYKKGTAVLTLNDSVSDDVIKKIIEDDGYKFV